MGRTKRKRALRIKNRPSGSISLENVQETISLKKWLNRMEWENHSKLILKQFSNTGRGVASLLNIRAQQRLIEIPYHLLITCANVFESEIVDYNLFDAYKKFKTQDLLAIFLAIERHKHDKSKWKSYLDTLPDVLPDLPWLCNDSESLLIPSELIKIVKQRKWDLETSWERVKKSINSNCKCVCCKQPLYRVINFNEFTWGYVMVNTRAVYVQPDIIRKFSRQDLSSFLSDEPCLALCPFMDMFNHSTQANIKAELVCVGDSLKYALTTLISYKKHQQIFISYGAHDNEKLFCEYGFFLRYNDLDCIRFDLEDIVNSCNTSLNRKQRAFIKSRCLSDELYVSIQGLSFNLKAAFFVALKSDADWAYVIYSGSYESSHYLFMWSIVRDLVVLKKSNYIKEINSLQCVSISKYSLGVIDYCKNRINFMERVLVMLENDPKDYCKS